MAELSNEDVENLEILKTAMSQTKDKKRRGKLLAAYNQILNKASTKIGKSVSSSREKRESLRSKQKEVYERAYQKELSKQAAKQARSKARSRISQPVSSNPMKPVKPPLFTEAARAADREPVPVHPIFGKQQEHPWGRCMMFDYDDLREKKKRNGNAFTPFWEGI